MYSGDIKILNCQNYGDIYNEAYSAGGLMGYCYGSAYVDNFVNDAKIVSGSNAAGFIGYVASVGSAPCNIVITNSSCFLDGRQCVKAYGFFGMIAKSNSIYMKNIKLDIKNNDERAVLGVINFIQEQSVFELKNAFINVESNKTIKFDLVRNITSLTGSVDMTNIHLKTNFDASGIKLVDFCPQKIKFAKNVIIESSVKDSAFYGSDFSGFYFSWKTGGFGLISFDGRGQFQGTIDAEWLKNRGFTEKSA